jgi:type II secretory pathway pseudopilin PulG
MTFGPHNQRVARKRRSRQARGSALFLVLILSVLMAAVMAGLVSHTAQVARMEKRSNTRLEATYAGEYALEQAYQQLSTLVGQDSANLPTISQTTAVTNLTTAPTGQFTAAQGYTWQSFLTVPTEAGAVVAAHSSFNPAQGSYKFLSVVEFTRTLPLQAPVHVQLQREWTYVLTPLFQYAIFYNGDMELFPGATFVVNGRVHSNGKVYTGTTASITFSDYVSDVSGLSNQYSPLDPRAPGSPGSNITYAKGNPVTTTAEQPPGTLSQNTSDTNPNNDGPRELVEVPDFLNSDPNAADRLYNKAGLKVLVNSTASAAAAASGVNVPANARVYLTQDGTTIPATDPLATYLGTMLANGTMKDYRENATLTTVDIDVSRVTAGYNSGGLPQTIPSSATWPNNASVPAALKSQPIPAALQGKNLWNGVLYVTDITNSAAHRTGIRLLNGTSLPDGTNGSSPAAGLTVASNNAAYIVGDYNTGGTPPVDSGTSLTANNYASGYTVQPAAVVADAVTVVSANWISGNYNTVTTLASRTPANTTINTAVIAGIVSSNGSAYSGGVENYFRLLENWSGKRVTYYGSIINLFDSQQSTAPWQNTGVYYNAPTRNWYFDVNFLDPRKLPPGTPVARSLKRSQWVQVQ